MTLDRLSFLSLYCQQDYSVNDDRQHSLARALDNILTSIYIRNSLIYLISYIEVEI